MKEIIFIFIVLLLSYFTSAQNPAAFAVNNKFYDRDGNIVFQLPEHQKLIANTERNNSFRLNRNVYMAAAYPVLDEKTDEILIVNPFGKLVANLGIKYYLLSPFIEGKARAFRKMEENPNACMLSYIDLNGNVLFNGKEFWEAEDFSEGLALIQLEDKKGDIGFIDEKGEFKINLTKNLKYFSTNGNASKNISDKETPINGFKNGRFLIRKNEMTADKERKEVSYFMDKEGNLGSPIEKALGSLIPPYIPAEKKNKQKTNSVMIAGSAGFSDYDPNPSFPKSGHYLERNKKGFLELTIFQDSLKTLYYIDEQLNVLGKATSTSFRSEMFDNNKEHLNFSNQLFIKQKITTKPNMMTHHVFNIKGDSILKASTEQGEESNWKNIFAHNVWVYAANENYLVLNYQSPKDEISDTLVIYDIKKKKEIFSSLGCLFEMYNDSLLQFEQWLFTPKKQIEGYGSNWHYTEITKLYRFDGKKVYETPSNEMRYFFEKQTEESDYKNIDKQAVINAKFKQRAIEMAYLFPNLEELVLDCDRETLLREQIRMFKKLRYLEIQNKEIFKKQELPKAFKKLKKLEHLSLVDGRFTNLIDILRKMPKLKTIDIQLSDDLANRPNFKAEIEAVKSKFPKKKITVTIKKDDMFYNPMFFPNKGKVIDID